VSQSDGELAWHGKTYNALKDKKHLTGINKEEVFGNKKGKTVSDLALEFASYSLPLCGRSTAYSTLSHTRLIFDTLNKIYILCCCFLRFFNHWQMAAIFDDYSFVIFQSLFENRYTGNIKDFILIAPKN